MDISNGITDEIVGRCVNGLVLHDMVRLSIDEGYGEKRLVIAAMQDEEELMIALEGSGCIFLKREDATNPFVFIKNGFNIRAANSIADLLISLMAAYAALDLRARHLAQTQPQLPHHSRS